MAEDVIQATKHKTLSIPTGVLDPIPVGLFVNVAGSADLVMADETGRNTTTISYNLSAGAMLPVRPQQVSGGTATLIALY